VSERISWLRGLAPWPALRAHTHVMLLVLACIVPMLGVSAFAIKTLADSGREQNKTQTMSTARALSAAVDLKLKTGTAALATLSTFQELPVADLKPFYERCAETARQNHAWIILTDTSGEPIFNTRAPLGAPLPHLQMMNLLADVVRSRAVKVSGIFKGSLTSQFQVSVLFPIVRQDQVTHVLVMSFAPDEIARVLVDQNLPESWRVVVVDREHRVIARNRALHEFDGAVVAPALAEQLTGASEASFTGLDRLGNDLMSTFTTSAYSGWALVVGLPVAEATVPLYRSLLSMGLAAGGMLLLGIVLAAFVGSRLNRSMGWLSSAAMALALGGETPLTLAKTKVAEINDVMSSLGRASEQLLERARQRDQAEAARRELEQQLQHSQKLEALGVLAGGIAHDLNNTLVPIFVTVKLGIKHAAEDSRMRQRFELIYEAGVRARDLIKRILAFSRKDAVDRQNFRLDRIISEDLTMLRESIPTTIAIEADIRPVPEIFGDPVQARQVVVNLVTNAVHAIGGGLGTVAVSLSAVAEGTAGEKPIVRLRVRDSGCGMDEATKRRIFEPFFTTKPVGEGTGLSMVHGIVTSLGGTIRVESEPGKGTCFTIELPPTAAPGECALACEEVAA